jgi:hypothetical protein
VASAERLAVMAARPEVESDTDSFFFFDDRS